MPTSSETREANTSRLSTSRPTRSEPSGWAAEGPVRADIRSMVTGLTRPIGSAKTAISTIRLRTIEPISAGLSPKNRRSAFARPARPHPHGRGHGGRHGWLRGHELYLMRGSATE